MVQGSHAELVLLQEVKFGVEQRLYALDVDVLMHLKQRHHQVRQASTICEFELLQRLEIVCVRRVYIGRAAYKRLIVSVCLVVPAVSGYSCHTIACLVAMSDADSLTVRVSMSVLVTDRLNVLSRQSLPSMLPDDCCLCI